MARCVIIIEKTDAGLTYCNVANNKIPKETLIMQLRSYIRDLDEEYFDSAASYRNTADDFKDEKDS